MPGSNNIHELQELVANSRDIIGKTVIFACRKYNHGAPDEVEELTEQIIVRLLEDGCHRLNTFDPAKAKFSTWLQNVVNHHVSHYYQRNPCTGPIEDLPENQLCVAAPQEKELLTKEQQALLQQAINQLTPHDQCIARLKIGGATDEEIAQEMKVKIRSVQQEWARIFKKIVTIFSKGGGKNYAKLTSYEKYIYLSRQHCVTKRL